MFFLGCRGGRRLGEKMPWVLVQLILTTQKKTHFLFTLWKSLSLVGHPTKCYTEKLHLSVQPLIINFCIPIWRGKVPFSFTFKLSKNATCAPYQDSRFFHTVQYKLSTPPPTVHSQDDPLVHYFSILTHIMKDMKKSPFTATRSFIWMFFLYNFSFHIPRLVKNRSPEKVPLPVRAFPYRPL